MRKTAPSIDAMPEDPKHKLGDIELTDRELLVAKAAAKLAVKEMQDEFYRQVGKSVVTRVLVFVGIAAVAFAAGRGWIKAIS